MEQRLLGADIPPLRGHIEGVHLEQTKRLVINADVKLDGGIDAVYQSGAPRPVHTIPFSKKEVDKFLFGEHPLGADSMNITNPDNVVYNGKFEGIRGVSGFRCNDYTYDQFVTPGWEQFLELARKSGGPASRQLIVPDKPKLIT